MASDQYVSTYAILGDDWTPTRKDIIHISNIFLLREIYYEPADTK